MTVDIDRLDMHRAQSAICSVLFSKHTIIDE